MADKTFGAKGWTPAQLGTLTGKTYLITGANSGAGFQATRILLSKGAAVVMLNRNPTRSEAAIAALHAAAPAPTTTMVLVGSGPADKRDRAHVEPKTPMRTDDDGMVEEGASGGSSRQRGGSGKLRRDARPSPLASTVSGAPSSVA